MDSITHPTAAIITPLAVAQMGSIGATITGGEPARLRLNATTSLVMRPDGE